MVDRFCTRVTEYTDTTTRGDWSATEPVVESPIDLHEYLLHSGVSYAYPWAFSDQYTLEFGGKGLVAADQQGATSVLIPLEVVLPRSHGKRIEHLRYEDCFETVDHLLFVFREGLFSLEGESREFLIPIPKLEVRKALGRTPAIRLPWSNRRRTARP